MKKLKIKIFVIIFLMLSSFLLGVFVINSAREYTMQKNSINNILNITPQSPRNGDRLKLDNNPREIFLDYTIYTILLDNNGDYLDMINHTNNESIDKNSIIKIANKILNNNNKKYVSNLIFNNYSYSINNNTLTIIDNHVQTNRMQKYILSSLISLILLEIIVYFISKFLTKWITDPVNESFEREKRFLADASHELKTPISVIMASVDAYNNDKDNKWITNIKSESERMSKLVKELLDLTKLENDKEFIKANQNISKIIESSVLTFESLFYENKLKLDYNIADKIYFNCNQDSIKELMSILIDNAIKYSDAKGKVTVNLYKEDKDIILETKNKGIPIEEKDKEKIFERFYKIDESRNRKTDNYGLGLSIAKRIVELHDGTITANSINRLTTFKIILNQK